MKYSLIISIFIISIISLCSAGIPELLLKCYSPEEYPTYSEMPPLNLQLFVELLRKIEFKELMAHNIRVLTSMLYHRYFFFNVTMRSIQIRYILESN